MDGRGQAGGRSEGAGRQSAVEVDQVKLGFESKEATEGLTGVNASRLFSKLLIMD